MVGFWLLFLVYPLNGTHHYVFSSIPMEAQKGAVVASVYLGVDVILVVGQPAALAPGQAGTVAADVPLRFVWVGVVAYLVVSLQGSAQAVMSVNRFVHFTDWVIGHSHLAMIGFASFAALGGLLHAWRRTPGCRYNPAAANWAFWLLAVGLTAMVADLTAAGLVQGVMWQGDGPWIDSVSASKGFWVARSVSGFLVLAGFLAVVRAVTSGAAATAPAPAADTVDADPVVHDSPPGLNWLKRGYVLTGVAGLGLFAFSFVVLGVWPNRTLTTQIAETRPADRPARTASEERGRLIYAREGCMTCHSQLVRFTEDDVRRFGVASQAWEADGDAPRCGGRGGSARTSPARGAQVAGLAVGPPVEPPARRPGVEHARLPVAVRRLGGEAGPGSPRRGQLLGVPRAGRPAGRAVGAEAAAGNGPG